MYNDDEMKQPATKADLKKLEVATREDIRKFQVATQEDIQKLQADIQKHEIAARADFHSIAKELVRFQVRADATEKRILDQMSDFRSDILKVVDDFMGQTGKVDRRQIIIDHRIDRLEKRVNKIESRPHS